MKPVGASTKSKLTELQRLRQELLRRILHNEARRRQQVQTEGK